MVPLCRTHHIEVETIGLETFQKKYNGLDLVGLAAWLWKVNSEKLGLTRQYLDEDGSLKTGPNPGEMPEK